MIDPTLFAATAALDRVQHRALRLQGPTPLLDRTAGMNALFITAVEFSDVCREYPDRLRRSRQGPDGQREVAPMAVLGLREGREPDVRAPTASWAARYMPALLRGYPLGLAPVDDAELLVVHRCEVAGAVGRRRRAAVRRRRRADPTARDSGASSWSRSSARRSARACSAAA